jgi:enamine deaminase RidA (YjgF/YER057c/UK114 family)
LYLADMALFPAVNAEYCLHFPQRCPPSRSCVQVQLAAGSLVALDALFLRQSYASMLSADPARRHVRQVLHVRSLSAWAPQCIGPYAQANSLQDSLLLVAGQIPLVAGTMQLLAAPGDQPAAPLRQMAAEALLCMRHVQRIASAQRSSLPSLLSCVLYVNTSAASYRAHPKPAELWAQLRRVLSEAFQQLCAEAAALCRPGQELEELEEEQSLSSQEEEEEEEQRAEEPVWLLLGVPALPRQASVELEAMAVKEAVLLPASAWRSLGSCQDPVAASSSGSGSGGAAGGRELAATPLEQWPLWTMAAAVDCTAPFPPLRVQTSARYYPTCIATGSIAIHLSHGADGDEVRVEIEEVAEALIASLLRLLQQAKLPLNTLRSLRIFACCCMAGSELAALEGMCKVLLERHGGAGCRPGIVSLEVSALPSDHEGRDDMAIQVLLLAIDLQQIETERWISNTHPQT